MYKFSMLTGQAPCPMLLAAQSAPSPELSDTPRLTSACLVMCQPAVTHACALQVVHNLYAPGGRAVDLVAARFPSAVVDKGSPYTQLLKAPASSFP